MDNPKAADMIVEPAGRDPQTLAALSALRLTVFREWPYLYDGDPTYEERYLRDFLSSEQAALIVAKVDARPVGMATASPLSNQPDDLLAPLIAAGIDAHSTFYFGESVLLPAYRGLGIGSRFFAHREAATRAAGATQAVFCAVIRSVTDPARATDVCDLKPFWRSRGYAPLEGVQCTMSWKEHGGGEEKLHPMQFWHKTLVT
jgi:GNAT superfamily N-acetyltransferase